MTFSKACVILGFLLTFGCKSTNPKDSQLEIMGGRSSKAYPAVGLLDINDGGGTCTGTLIAPRVVLTAAHCVTSDSFAPFHLNKSMAFIVDGQRFPAVRWVHHPDYNNFINQCFRAGPLASQKLYRTVYDCESEALGNTCDRLCETCYRSADCQACVKNPCRVPTDACNRDKGCLAIRACEVTRHVDEMPNDIALVILKSPVSSIVPASLGNDVIQGETIDLVGFGPRAPDRPDTLGTKSKGTNQISEVYEQAYTYHGNTFGRANLLGGDSGGPSFGLRSGTHQVLGVHSNTSSYCDSAQLPVGVDIRVEAYRQWIKQESP